MTKVALLKTAVQVVKSAESLPATRPNRQYADFDVFVANTKWLVGFFDGVAKADHELVYKFDWLKERAVDLARAKRQIAEAEYIVSWAKDKLAEFPRASKRLAQAKRDEKWYDRNDLYELKGKGKRKQRTLSRRVVSEQIALLLASFQNSRPGTPKVFGKMLIEEVYANSPNAIILEAACRAVRREKSFPPSIAEVLKAIKKESSAWCDRWDVLDDYDANVIRQNLEQAIVQSENAITQAKAKLAEFEAAAEAERKARAASDRGRCEAQKGQPMAVPPEYDEDEARRYRFAFEQELELKVRRAGSPG